MARKETPKLPKTIKPYNKVSNKLFSIFYNKALKSKVIAYRNGKGKFLSYKKLEDYRKTSLKKQKKILVNRVKQNFEKIADKRYINKIDKTDYGLKPKKARKTYFIQSTLKYHVFIYQKGKRKKTQNLVIGDADFIIFERDVSLKQAFAEINEDVKIRTGYDLKTYLGYKFIVKNLFVEGGFRLRKFKIYSHGKEKMYYDKEIKFSDL